MVVTVILAGNLSSYSYICVHVSFELSCTSLGSIDRAFQRDKPLLECGGIVSIFAFIVYSRVINNENSWTKVYIVHKYYATLYHS